MKELVYHRMLLPQVDARADEVGFIDGDYRATFAQHLDRVGRVAQVLRHDLGVDRSDRFAVMALNSHQYMELWHAAFLGAGVMNPLNLRLAPKELAYILENSGTKVVFTDFLFAGVIEQVREQAGIEQVEAGEIERILRRNQRGQSRCDGDRAEHDGGKRGARPLRHKAEQPAWTRRHRLGVHRLPSRLMRGSSIKLKISTSVLVTTKMRPTKTR